MRFQYSKEGKGIILSITDSTRTTKTLLSNNFQLDHLDKNYTTYLYKNCQVSYLLVGSVETSNPGGMKTMSSQSELELSCNVRRSLSLNYVYNTSYYRENITINDNHANYKRGKKSIQPFKILMKKPSAGQLIIG